MTYTQRYVGAGGSDANDGTTVALRKLTIDAMESALSAATRYTVNIRQGTYRESVALDVSGLAAYAAGTVSVTNGNTVVTGSGTSWLANAELNDWFQVQVLASGTDGVTTAVTATSHTFTSAAGNFQAGHVGYTIRIGTIGAYIITAVGAANSITIAKPDNSSFLMVAGTGLTYNIGPESPHKVASVDSDTQITLAQAWAAPSFTGLAYQVWGHIEYVGDYSGAIFGDNSGDAPVRITGSNNDQTVVRAACITNGGRSFRTFLGLGFDSTSGNLITSSAATGTNWVIQKCYFSHGGSGGAIQVSNAGNTAWTIQNCLFALQQGNNPCINFTTGTTTDNVAQLVQNCILIGGSSHVLSERVGGIWIRNCVSVGRASSCYYVSIALAVGQAMTVNNCLIASAATAGVRATTTGELIENYNDFYSNVADRTNALTGANSVAYPLLLDMRPSFQLMHAQAAAQLVSPFDLASYSQLVNLAGINPPATDLRGQAILGAQREWGALEFDSTYKILGAMLMFFNVLRTLAHNVYRM